MTVATPTKQKRRPDATSAAAQPDSLDVEAAPAVPSSAAGAPLPASREMGRLESIDPSLVDVGANVRQDVGDLAELVDSIREHGLLQPIKVVGPFLHSGRYELVWGQRRLRACQQLDLSEIPAIVVSPATQPEGAERTILQLLENVQRDDLNAVELARSLKALEGSGLTQADIARQLGKSAPYVSNAIRILEADPEVLRRVERGELSATHARALLGLPAADQRSIASRVVTDKLSAHQLENEIKWKRDAATQAENRVKATNRWTPKAIAALEAAGVAKGTPVYVHGSAYNLEIADVRKAVGKAGWKLLDRVEYMHFGTEPTCDCTAMDVEVGGRKAIVKKACIDHRHVDRAINARHIEQKTEQERKERLWAEVAKALRPQLEQLPVPLLRLLASAAKRGSGWFSPWSSFDGLDPAAAVDEIVASFARVSEVNPEHLLTELGYDDAGMKVAAFQQLVAGVNEADS